MWLEVHIKCLDVRRNASHCCFFSILALPVYIYMHFQSHHIAGKNIKILWTRPYTKNVRNMYFYGLIFCLFIFCPHNYNAIMVHIMTMVQWESQVSQKKTHFPTFIDVPKVIGWMLEKLCLRHWSWKISSISVSPLHLWRNTGANVILYTLGTS